MDEDIALGLSGGGAGVLPAAASAVTISPPGVIAQVGAPQADDYRRAGTHQRQHPGSAAGRRAPPGRRGADAVRPAARAAPDRCATRSSTNCARAPTCAPPSRRSTTPTACPTCNPMLRLPLASLAFPQLRRRPRAELRSFMDTVYALVHADGEVSLFEYCLGRLLRPQVPRRWIPRAPGCRATARLAGAR